MAVIRLNTIISLMIDNIQIELQSDSNCECCKYNYFGVSTDQSQIDFRVKDLCDDVYSNKLVIFWLWLLAQYASNINNSSTKYA